MGSARQKGVVVKLVGIPIVKRSSAGKACVQSRKATTDTGVGVVLSWEGAQRRVPGGGVDRRDRLVVNHLVTVKTKPRAVDQGRAENVGFFQGCDVADGLRQVTYVIKGVRLSVGGLVICVGREQAVFIVDLVIHSSGVVVFLCNSHPGKSEGRFIGVGLRPPVGIERQVLRHGRVHRYVTGRQVPRPRRVGR